MSSGPDRPYAWEKSYPPGVRWDAPLATMPLPQLLAEAVAAYGPRPVIEYRGRSISYDELGRMADAAAAALLRRGLGAGQSVALYLPNTPEHPIAFFGALKAGARIVHLSPLDAELQLMHKLRDSGARTLVTTNIGTMLPIAAKLLQAGLVDLVVTGDETAYGPPAVPVTPISIADPRIVSLDRLLAEGAGPPPKWPLVDVADLAVLQYTGGTTGVPKGAMLTHGNLSAAVSMYDAWFRGQGYFSGADERVICVLPLFHIYGLTTILLLHLRNGSELLMRMRFDAETTLRDIEERRATSLPGVPTMWIALAAQPGIERRNLSSLRHVGSGGAPLPVEVAQRFAALTGLQLGGGWGMTETAPAGTIHPRAVSKPDSVGLPAPGIILEVVALDDPRRVLPPNQRGELRIKGPNVTQGYWNRPEESAAAFVDGFFLTGDIGFMDEDGYFHLVDRKKDMIISGGFNVYPTAVENAIYQHPDVAEVTVIGIPDRYRGEAAKAFIRLRDGAAPFSLEALQAFLADKLGRQEMPAVIEFRTTLPRTAVGKLSRKELIEEERAKAAAAPSA